jgi:HD-GYP domain-containing protein (c-di-GMP phosphodiesterase class II)
MYGRIVAVADVFDSLYSDRVYRKALPLQDVLDIIRVEQGHHFDPRLATLLLKHQDEFTAISERFSGVLRLQEPLDPVRPQLPTLVADPSPPHSERETVGAKR